jgi:hypothetical protein
MATVSSGVIPMHSLRTALIALTTSFATLSLASGQSISDFVISSPRPVIQLVQVEQIPPENNPYFTFRNVSDKTILAICISEQRGPKEMVCDSGFSNGSKLTGPGETFSLSLDANGFASDGQQNSLRVNAVIYTDGSHFGESTMLARLRGEMFGVTLETKRVSDLLSNGPDDSAAALDGVLSQIGTTRPSSKDEAARILAGESLPGISPLAIDSYLRRPTQGILEGVVSVRDNVLHDIEDEKSVAALPLTGGTKKQQAVLEARLHGRSDLAQKYQALLQLQISYLISFMGGEDIP